MTERLPKVAVVFDRFHLVELMNGKLDELRRFRRREATERMQATVKGTRWLLVITCVRSHQPGWSGRSSTTSCC